MPKLIHYGIINQIHPYEPMTSELFLYHYKLLIVTVIDPTTNYEKLLDGKLLFYRGNVFCETIIQATTIEEVTTLLDDYWHQQKLKTEQYEMRVSRK